MGQRLRLYRNLALKKKAIKRLIAFSFLRKTII